MSSLCSFIAGVNLGLCSCSCGRSPPSLLQSQPPRPQPSACCWRRLKLVLPGMLPSPPRAASYPSHAALRVGAQWHCSWSRYRPALSLRPWPLPRSSLRSLHFHRSLSPCLSSLGPSPSRTSLSPLWPVQSQLCPQPPISTLRRRTVLAGAHILARQLPCQHWSWRFSRWSRPPRHGAPSSQPHCLKQPCAEHRVRPCSVSWWHSDTSIPELSIA